MAIDAEKDEDFQRLTDYEPVAGVEFYKLKEPEGKKLFGYRIEFVEDMTTIKSKFTDQKTGAEVFNKVASVKFLKVWNDEDVKPGDIKRINFSRHASCDNYFERTGLAKKGLVLDIMIKHKVKGKGPSKYFPYAILPAEGEFDAQKLLKYFE